MWQTSDGYLLSLRTMARRIALVEDDPTIRQNYSDALTRAGYEVAAFADRASASRTFAARLPELAIIDIGLGADVDGGFALCHELRAASERRKLLAGVARIGAGVLGVQAEPATRSRTAAQEPPVDRFAAIHGLYWLCANRAERGPIVVTVDDVQWADPATLIALGTLPRHLLPHPILWLLAVRSGELEPAVRAALTRLEAADAIIGALAANDFAGTRLGAWEPGFTQGMDRMRRLVVEFYDGFSFGRFVKRHPRFKGHLTDLLIGDLFKDSVDEVIEPMNAMRAEAVATKAAGSNA